MPRARRSDVTRLLLALLLAFGAVGVVTTSPAHACSCAGSTIEQRAPETDAIFQGEVVDVASAGSGRAVYTFEVLQVWKGTVGAEVDVYTSGSGASCGLEIEYGQRDVIYADVDGSRLSSGLCSAPFGSGGKAALTALLGPPTTPDPPGEIVVLEPPWLTALRDLIDLLF